MDRIHRLEAAIEIARALPCSIEKMHGAEWLEKRLKNSFVGAATIVFHSAVWQYISDPEQQQIVTIIEDAGKRGSKDAPVAWLRMETVNNRFEIRLRIYPGFGGAGHRYIAGSYPVSALASKISGFGVDKAAVSIANLPRPSRIGTNLRI